MFRFSMDGSGIGSLILNRPPANAFTGEGLEDLERYTAQVADMQELKVLLVRSETGFFSAGADIKMIGRMADDPDGPRRLTEFAARFQKALQEFRAIPVCTIAEIRGPATGGGFELALSCDIRVIGHTVKCGLPEIKLGLLAAAGGTQMVAELAGKPTAFRLTLTGDLIEGKEAAELGLVQYAVADPEVESFARALARRLASLPRMAITANKRCVTLSGTEHGFISEIIGTSALHHQPETRALIGRFLHARGQ